MLEACEQVGIRLKKSKNGILDYEKLREFLEQNGAVYHFGSWINPISYTVLRLLSAFAGLFLGTCYALWAGILLMVLLFLLPDVMLGILNGRDNEAMLSELKLVYHAIAIQIRAGVHVTDALTECYGSVKHIRLKTALFTLSGEIAAKSDVEEALEQFQNKFNNRYVDALCMTVLQTLESGQAVDLLSDIGEQMKDMETALMNRRKSNLDRSVTFYQLCILSEILAVVLYACVVHMLTAAITF